MTDRSASGRPPARREPDDSHQTVASLLEERSKYQSWIDALDARRDSSPEHVFRRVRKDYEQRLAEVAAQLARQLPALRDATRGLATRIADLRSEESALQDARAEAELRAHVGELAGEKWEKAARKHDDGIAAVVARRVALEAELAVVEGLVASTRDSIETAAIPRDADANDADGEGAADDDGEAAEEGAAEDEAGALPAAAAAPKTGAPSRQIDDELEFLRSITGPGGAGADAKAALVARKAKVAAAEAEARAARKQAKNEQPLIVPAAAPATPEPPAEPKAAAEAEGEADAADAPTAEPAAAAAESSQRDGISADPSPDKDAPRRDSGSFFDPADESNPLRDIRSAERPLGGNVLGSDSIVLRADSSQPKTLKCAGCGTMNFPTEWYCERCGAELAEL